MKEGGAWRAFREASKQRVTAAIAAEELERPSVAHRISAVPPTVPKLHEQEPDVTPEFGTSADDLVTEPGPAEGDELEASPKDPAAQLVTQARAWLIRNASSPSVESGMQPSRRERLTSWIKALPKRLAHWSVLAIVPVAAATGLLAVRAGVNPYALCLQWWDMAYGAVFLTASLVFLGLAIWKGPRGAWHPGAPALAVAVVTAPLWLTTNLVFGGGCQEIPAEPILVPPLPPPIEVPNVWTVPVPQPRPFDLFPPPAQNTQPATPMLPPPDMHTIPL